MVTALFFARPSGKCVALNFSIGSNIMSEKYDATEPQDDKSQK